MLVGNLVLGMAVVEGFGGGFDGGFGVKSGGRRARRELYEVEEAMSMSMSRDVENSFFSNAICNFAAPLSTRRDEEEIRD